MGVRRWPILIVGEMSTMTNWVRAKLFRGVRPAFVVVDAQGIETHHFKLSQGSMQLAHCIMPYHPLVKRDPAAADMHITYVASDSVGRKLL